ncbi:MAG: hypothetical protein NUW01_02780 [Gemmatimonadaceae bacterium]|nr:hypothetical protein [Gemmatimonadaceae bacterium]
MSRADTIRELLKWLPEATGGGGGSLGDWIGSGPDSKILTYGPLWYQAEPTWRELTRCLALLKEHRPSQYQHLNARYWAGNEARRQVRHVKRGGKFVPLGLDPHQEITSHPATFAYTIARHHTGSSSTVDCLVYTWPAWVRQHKVDLAVEYLASRFHGSPFLPVAVLAA